MTYVQIQFAVDDPERADRIVGQLLADRLVACGQRTGPVSSRYWWQGSLEQAEEWLVLLKTRRRLEQAVIEAVVGAHPYQTPEVISHELSAVAPAYARWIDEVTVPAVAGATVTETGDG